MLADQPTGGLDFAKRFLRGHAYFCEALNQEALVLFWIKQVQPDDRVGKSCLVPKIIFGFTISCQHDVILPELRDCFIHAAKSQWAAKILEPISLAEGRRKSWYEHRKWKKQRHGDRKMSPSTQECSWRRPVSMHRLKTIGDRLQALGVAQDLLVRERWTGAGCRTLIESAVKAFQSKGLEQFKIVGENIAVSSGPAVSLSMVIHELCTNAVKYGALSVPDGRVAIEWMTADDRFKLRWKESGGPPVEPPLRQSFGSRLIEQALPGQLSGEARLRFEPDGVNCEINIPLAIMQER